MSHPSEPSVEAREKVERVAQAMWEDVGGYVSGVPWERAGAWNQAKYRRLAAAAIAAMPVSPAEAALRRVEALADDDEEVARMAREYETDKARRRERDYWHTLAGVREQSAARIRAALAAPQTGEHTTEDARLVRIGLLADRLGKQGLTDEQITAVLLITRPDLMQAGEHTTDEEGR